MRKISPEPSLLQVFRFYAWLRLPAAALSLVSLLHIGGERPQLAARTDAAWVIAFIILHTLLLVVYLYLPGLPRRLGGAFIPLGLGLATAGILIEQYLVSFQRFFWGSQPFLYILLILVAWQYSLRGVTRFTIFTAGLDISLSLLLPLHFQMPGPDGPPPWLVYYGILTARSVTFVLIGFVVSRLADAQRAQGQALAKANQRLVSHAARLEQLATTRERVRLSRDLHDTLAHTLSAQAVQIDAILSVWQDIPERAQGMLERMLSSTRSGLDETRRVLSDLRAAPLDELGLVDALRSMVEDFAQRHNLQLDLHLPESTDDLPPEVELCFYRVAQEALENVSRHAAACRLEVRLEATPQRASLLVCDDGQGFAPQALSGDGLGVQGMRERAELIDAHFSLDSRPGEGAALHLDWEAHP
ncbi:MAG: sensor histidine kinase [Chloroflexota bacterium]